MKTSIRFILVGLLAVLAACGGTPSNPDAGPVTITPEAVSVKAGDSTPLTASVQGATEAKVLWSVEGGAASGTITSTGVYTAPATAGTYTVVATNAVDSTKKANATVTVTPAVVVTLTPANPAVNTTGSIAFSATVTGASDTSVTWSVRQADGGSITAAGVYTAPATAGLYTVVATSKADPSREASTQVRVETVGVTVAPTNVTLDAGAVAEFSAQVTGSTNTGVDWSVEGGAASGTITAAGIYTAPAAAGLYTVVATSKADPSRKGTATVSVRSVSVSISPATQTVSTGGTAAFYAQVTGSGGSTAVTWSVAGSSDNGTITAAGVYTAPGTAGTFTVVATSVADPSKKATATVTVIAVRLTVNPETATSAQGAATVFSAEVTGTSNKAVSWSVEGGAANGTITASGIYTAPPRQGTFTVVATSEADPSKKASATITVSAVGISVTPASVSLEQGRTATFSASVTGTLNKDVSWSVEGGTANGTITPEGLYTPPVREGTFTVVATSAADPSKKASATVTVAAVGISVTPTFASLEQGKSAAFRATVTGTPNREVAWSVVGGDAQGTITPEGLYTAPNREGSFTVVAVSMADPSKKASATVAVSAVGISVTPTSVTLDAGKSAPFSATVTGTVYKEVAWSVEGGAANGTITPEGLYTAPSRPGTFTVVAVSVVDSTKKATATVTVTESVIAISVTPGSATSEQGATTAFSATVTGSSNTAVLWSVTGGAANGTITSEGVYTAPLRPGTFTVVATSAADSSKKASATVTVPEAAGADYQDPPGTGWRLVKNPGASSGNRIVLELVGPAGESGRGVDLTLAVDPALAFWDKVEAADPEPVRNLKFELGTAPQYYKGAIQAGTLKLGVFQKGTSAPATEYSGGLISVALAVKLNPAVPAGTRIPVSVLKAHALPATSGLTPITVAVGTLTAR